MTYRDLKRVYLTALVALPLLGVSGCAALRSDPVPPQPGLQGINAANAALQDDIQNARHGGLPDFQPLQDAQTAVKQAKAQPQVENYDADALSQAEAALAKAQSDWQTIGANEKRTNAQVSRVADEAHRAQRLAQIARYTARREIGLQKLNTLTQSINTSSTESGALPSVSDQELFGHKVVPDMLGALQFEQGNARLTGSSHAVIDRLAQLISQHPKVGVALFGFAENVAPDDSRLKAFMAANPGLEKQAKTRDQQVEAYNIGLSNARARDVAQLLVAAGVDPKRIGARGLGTQHPIASNDTANGRQQNARVEAVIIPLNQGS